MAEIPRLTPSLSIPSSGAGPRISSRGAGAAGAALARFGETATRIGEHFAEQQAVARREKQIIDGRGQMLTGLNDLQLELERSDDPGAILETFGTRAGEIKDRLLADVSDPAVRTALDQDFQALVEPRRVSLARTAFAREGDQALAAVDQTLTTIAQQAGPSSNRAEIAALVEQAGRTIDGAAAAGYISATDAGIKRRAFARQLEEARLTALLRRDPVAALAELGMTSGDGDLAVELARSESGGQPGAVSRTRDGRQFVGKYQFGEAAAAAAGFYIPDDDPGDGAWNGRFVNLGADVGGLDDFLTNEEAQDEAFSLHLGNLRREMLARGLSGFVGQEIAGVEVTEPGLLAAMHLAGPQGTQRFLESGGEADPSDQNGTRISTYLARFAGVSEGAARTNLPLDRRLVLADAAERELAAQRAARAEQTRQAREKALTGIELAIARGDGGFQDLEAARATIGESDYRRLAKTLIEQDAKQRDEETGLARVDAVLHGSSLVLLDPRDNDDRQNVDRYFERIVAPDLSQQPPETWPAAAALFASRVGMVPDALQRQVRGALRGGTAEQKAGAADLLARLQETNADLLADFKPADIELGLAIAERVRQGVPEKEAVQAALDARDVAPEVAERRRARARQEKHGEENAAFLEDRSRRGFGPFGDDLAIPDALAAEFDARVGDAFQRQGDLEVAQRVAWQRIEQTWAPSRVGGGGAPRWMKYAPERFGPRGLDPATNAEWMTEQLVADLRAGGAFDPNKGDLAQRLRLVPDATTAREADTAAAGGIAPSYRLQLLDPESGALVELQGEDGRPLRWRPDWKTAPARERLIADQRRREREEVEAAQRRRDLLRAQLGRSDASRAQEQEIAGRQADFDALRARAGEVR